MKKRAPTIRQQRQSRLVGNIKIRKDKKRQEKVELFKSSQGRVTVKMGWHLDLLATTMGRLATHYISAMKICLTSDLNASAMHTIHLHRYLTATVYENGACGFAQVSVVASLT